ncbi:MAG: glycosyltransferase family 4 protein [Candidatus Eisenbacteria bacterium]|uniref:Glycosyltransferase family 4 protein n=1 Tax=Eiseniibacteriota bacterium TaxID=2212470 RepID=A0A956NH78_UNCEI|nr:glycosyltransferase family 4 protein [Candidatus Eisenbacteria bacterium]MCB9463821.1 glycosyltransferase family 4 protein [Candidatus Eisenbacteria bacterium]
MRPRKVLFIETSPDPSFGGSKRVLVNLLGLLDRSRFVPRVLFAREGAFVDAVRDLGVEFEIEPTLVPPARRTRLERPASEDTIRKRVGVRRRADGEIERTGFRETVRNVRSRLHYQLRDRQRANQLLRRVPEDVELLHVNSPMHQQFVWAHVARTKGIPFVTHEHGIWRRPPSAFKTVAREAAALFCLTEDRVESVRQFCGGGARPVLLPNGVDLLAFRAERTAADVRSELAIPDGNRLLITSSHIQRWKGQNLVVQAARQLADAGVPFVWVLCGRILEPDFEAELRGEIERLDLGERVRFLGERTDVPDLLGAADVSIHTAVEPEPFGMVVIESMAVGTPVVGPREGAIPSILADGAAGRLYEPRDASDLARELERLLMDDSAREQIAVTASARVESTYSLREQVRRLEATYDAIFERLA